MYILFNSIVILWLGNEYICIEVCAVINVQGFLVLLLSLRISETTRWTSNDYVTMLYGNVWKYWGWKTFKNESWISHESQKRLIRHGIQSDATVSLNHIIKTEHFLKCMRRIYIPIYQAKKWGKDPTLEVNTKMNNFFKHKLKSAYINI